MKEFEIPHQARVRKLSFHSQRQLSLLLAVCQHPNLLLLDDPFAAIETETYSRFPESLRQILREWNTTIIVSSHRISDLEIFAPTHLARLGEGQIQVFGLFSDMKEQLWNPCELR